MTENKIPRSKDNDFTAEMVAQRRLFIAERSGCELEHVSTYSQDLEALAGNIENFTGVAQVPIGFAGPLLVQGEHAQGEFWVPLATTEGTLVASYNRGMRILREAGGARSTVVADNMQRAPVFIFENGRDGRDFGIWVRANYSELKQRAEATTSIGKLVDIERYQAGKMMFLRFDYTTGDAAGQNMTGRATDAACKWTATQIPSLVSYNLEGNFATDKKHSQINTLRTRGKRVVAEAVLPKELVADILHTTPSDLFRARQVSTIGCLLSASNNNGSHSANGITAMFIATGQDVACVAESSAAIAYAEITPDGDYYYSITIPSLIVATYGGGTGLATQRECLEVMDCYGRGKVYKLAEIIGATVLAGELSLGAAVVTDTWVSSHEKLGRNR